MNTEEQLHDLVDRANAAQAAMNALGVGKVRLPDRDQVIEVIRARLEHVIDLNNEEITPRILASLIADDILASQWKVERDSTMFRRGKDAGFERGLQDSIAAVGGVARCDYVTNSQGEAQLVMYQDAQRAIARLSTKGLESLWAEENNELQEKQ